MAAAHTKAVNENAHTVISAAQIEQLFHRCFAEPLELPGGSVWLHLRQ